MQNLHAGEAAIFAEFVDGVGDDAQVFGNNLRVANLLANLVKELQAGTFEPFAVNCGFRVAVNRPIRLEGAEMIDAHNVNKLINPLETQLPPLVMRRRHLRPIVLRIAPKLTRRAEIIGRNSRDFFGTTFLVKLKFLLISPRVRAVSRNEYRHVAHNLNPAFKGVFVKFVPLPLENELLELHEQNFVGKLLLQRGKNFFIALLNFDVPLNPIRTVIFLLDSGEQRVIVQPIFLCRAEFFEVLGKRSIRLEPQLEGLERFAKC